MREEKISKAQFLSSSHIKKKWGDTTQVLWLLVGTCGSVRGAVKMLWEAALKEGKKAHWGFRLESAFQLGLEDVDWGAKGLPDKK